MVWNCSFCFRNLEKGYSKREEQSGTCPTVIILSLGWVSVVGGQGTAGTARHSCLAGEKNTRTLQGCFVRIVSLLCNWQVAGKDQGGSGMRFAHLFQGTRGMNRSFSFCSLLTNPFLLLEAVGSLLRWVSHSAGGAVPVFSPKLFSLRIGPSWQCLTA